MMKKTHIALITILCVCLGLPALLNQSYAQYWADAGPYIYPSTVGTKFRIYDSGVTQFPTGVYIYGNIERIYGRNLVFRPSGDDGGANIRNNYDIRFNLDLDDDDGDVWFQINSMVDGNTTPLFRLRESDYDGDGWVGDLSIKGSYFARDLDLAEYIPATNPILEPGDVVVIDDAAKDSVKLSTEPYDTKVAGIISTSAGFILGAPDLISLPQDKENSLNDEMKIEIERIEKSQLQGKVKLTLAGRVPCKVSTENGAIKPGDLLTTSATPGHAMKCTEAKLGSVLGKALEPLNSGTGKIMVLISLQ